MANDPTQPAANPVEITPTEARQGLRGRHVAIILAVSTLLAASALLLFFLLTSAAA